MVLVAEQAYDGAQNVNYGTAKKFGKIGIRDDDDFVIEMKSDLSKFEYSFDGGTTTIDGGTLPGGIKNGSIQIANGNITGIGPGNNTKVDNTAIDITLETSGSNQGLSLIHISEPTRPY